jgi:hypothetical protein
MADPELAPTPVNVINPAVLSLLDHMFYRLPFPIKEELDRLIKADQCETAMQEFRAGLRADLDTPRAMQDFERGWDKYWRETGSASEKKPAKSFQDKTKSPSPEPGGSDGKEDGENGSGSEEKEEEEEEEEEDADTTASKTVQ